MNVYPGCICDFIARFEVDPAVDACKWKEDGADGIKVLAFKAVKISTIQTLELKDQYFYQKWHKSNRKKRHFHLKKFLRSYRKEDGKHFSGV